MKNEDVKTRKKCNLKLRITFDQALYILNRTRTEGKTKSDIIRELIENDRVAGKNTEVAQAQ